VTRLAVLHLHSYNILNSPTVLPSEDLDEMCYFDQDVFTCGDWKWRLRREGCNYISETCGMKLIMSSQYVNQRCNICQNIEVKQRRIYKLEDKIRR
jgi:hypothetical protein